MDVRQEQLLASHASPQICAIDLKIPPKQICRKIALDLMSLRDQGGQ